MAIEEIGIFIEKCDQSACDLVSSVNSPSMKVHVESDFLNVLFAFATDCKWCDTGHDFWGVRLYFLTYDDRQRDVTLRRKVERHRWIFGLELNDSEINLDIDRTQSRHRSDGSRVSDVAFIFHSVIQDYSQGGADTGWVSAYLLIILL